MWTLTKNKLKFVKEKMNDLEYVDLCKFWKQNPSLNMLIHTDYQY
jgi:hypothetical protein